MAIDRRAFFSCLAASGAAIAEVPEIETVETLDADKVDCIVVTFRHATQETMERFIREWQQAFPDGPRAICFNDGTTIQRLKLAK